MKPAHIVFWVVAAVMPVHALLCECGTIDEDRRWLYSGGLTRNTCKEVDGKIQDQKWPACIYEGEESTWKEKCEAQDEWVDEKLHVVKVAVDLISSSNTATQVAQTDTMLVATERWSTRIWIVIDIFNTKYDPSKAHLPGQNDLPVIAITFSDIPTSSGGGGLKFGAIWNCVFDPYPVLCFYKLPNSVDAGIANRLHPGFRKRLKDKPGLIPYVEPATLEDDKPQG
ncbi:hypothetical protein CSUB01_09638 [Colletotrichum sublineola]|uniref:Uncharacterized protein n=1 Tax=Colletotrichum sublineola TaxID=1173701 RepID=A0A066X1X7_COLSU|nr:hypothetical protein CSUB01_09638 [Colletotrichum sublineola]